MNDYKSLRDAVVSVVSVVAVSRGELAELLIELDYLRHTSMASKAPKDAYTAEFEAAWHDYPQRPGNSKAAAFKAWKGRIKSGATVAEMHDGVLKYAAYCKYHQTEKQYIKQAATFFGPGEHYSADWSLPDKNERMQRIMTDGWHKTADGILAKAKERGISPRPGEGYDDLKRHIIDDLNRDDE